MNAGGADFFPQIPNRIQTDELSTLRRVEQERIDDLQQHIRVMEIEIDLVRAERRPYLLYAGGGLEFGQERQGARPHHLRKVWAALHHNEIIAVARIVLEEGLEPGMFALGIGV